MLADYGKSINEWLCLAPRIAESAGKMWREPRTPSLGHIGSNRKGLAMQRPRLTIQALSTGIALVALDIVIWKADYSGHGLWVAVGMRGTLIATTVLVVALAFLLTGRGNRPFLVGFLRAGFAAELVYWVCCALGPRQVLTYLQNPIDQAVILGFFDHIPRLEVGLRQNSQFARLFFDTTCFPLIVTIHALPVLSIALLGGWASKGRAARAQQSRLAAP